MSSLENVLDPPAYDESTAAGQGRSRRPRVKPAGTAILEDFYKNIAAYPNKAQAKTLLAEVQAVPGCSQYTIHNLRAWFIRHRSTMHSGSSSSVRATSSHEPSQDHADTEAAPHPNTGPDIDRFLNVLVFPAYPSLNETSIQHLRILVQGQENPSSAVINIWALLLQATPEDIRAWLGAQRRDNGHYHPPTPAESTSPEPPTPISPENTFKPEPAMLNIPAPSTLANRPTLDHATIQTKEQDHPLPSHTKLAQAILQAIALTPESPQPLPTTSAEFNALFSPYEAKMKAIIQELGGGATI